MENNNPYIYRKQIVSTGKYYIGKHNGNNKYYKGSGVDYLTDLKLYVKDYKTDLIEEILEYCNIENINEREEYWLKLVDAANNFNYYNKTNRHRGWSQVTQEQRDKISKSNKGKKQTPESSLKKREKMLGIPKHSQESKDKIGIKNKHPKPEGFKEKCQKPKSQEHASNISKGKKGKSKLGRIILQLDIETNQVIKEYRSIKEAIYEHGKGAIWACCNNKRKIAKGYKWKYKN